MLVHLRESPVRPTTDGGLRYLTPCSASILRENRKCRQPIPPLVTLLHRGTPQLRFARPGGWASASLRRIRWRIARRVTSDRGSRAQRTGSRSAWRPVSTNVHSRPGAWRSRICEMPARRPMLCSKRSSLRPANRSRFPIPRRGLGSALWC